jgi:hypothetical protein
MNVPAYTPNPVVEKPSTPQSDFSGIKIDLDVSK